MQMAIHQQRQGRRIALWREQAGLSQEAAAAKAGVSHAAWQRWEGGKSTPYPRNWEKIAAVVGHSVEELRGDPPKSTDDVADQLDRIEAKLDQLLLKATARVTPTEADAALPDVPEELPPAPDPPPDEEGEEPGETHTG